VGSGWLVLGRASMTRSASDVIPEDILGRAGTPGTHQFVLASVMLGEPSVEHLLADAGS
jgi:hypothetical protein